MKILKKIITVIIIIQIAFSLEVFASAVPENTNILVENINVEDPEAYSGVKKDITQISIDDITKNSDVAEYEISCSTNGVNKYVGMFITISQIVGALISIILFIIGIINIIKNYLDSKKSIPEKGLYGDKATLSERKRPTIRYFVISIIIYCATGFFQIIKNFAKPIIYIYTDKEKEVKIKVKNPERLICTYPKYKDGWNVLAKPNGDLIDLDTNRKLYALYWEGRNRGKVNFKEGFIVEGENIAKFLEEKLEILGLNEREAEEFIVYWLPLMEKNRYNYIRFETIDEIEENMKLEITPEPETLIRINMVFKGLAIPFDIKEQKLEKVERKGYTVVEWGGTKL